ncbi:hypothetical protein Ahia01_000890000, partial [Argonauta hians]
HKPFCPGPPSRRNTIGLFPEAFSNCTITETEHTLVPADNSSVYEGTYYNQLYGNITVNHDLSSQKLFFTYGFVTFRLVAKSLTRHKFSAQGTGDMCFIRLVSVNFCFVPDSGIVSLTIPSFERGQPPTFEKII